MTDKGKRKIVSEEEFYGHPIPPKYEKPKHYEM
jgi:hypothetical protein